LASAHSAGFDTAAESNRKEHAGEDALLTGYQQSFVENRKAVLLEEKSFPVRVSGRVAHVPVFGTWVWGFSFYPLPDYR
jgi:hypothetical protein